MLEAIRVELCADIASRLLLLFEAGARRKHGRGLFESLRELHVGSLARLAYPICYPPTKIGKPAFVL